MKIKIESDIHLEFNKEYKPSGLEDTDVYILAGDIAQGIGSYRRYCQRLLNEYPKLKIIHVPGNHEYYNEIMERLDDRMLDIMDVSDRYYYLQNRSITIDGIKFIGSTLWTDYNRKNLRDLKLAWSRMNDYACITSSKIYGKVTPYLILQAHKKAVKYIFNTLNNTKGPCIVVTHHRPLVDINNPSPLQFAYEVDLSDNIETCSNAPLYWFFGHTHKSEAFTHKHIKTEFISNSLGYPMEAYTGFDKDLEIKII